MTTHKIIPKRELHTWPWKRAYPSLTRTDGILCDVGIDSDGDVAVEIDAEYGGNTARYIPRAALQALFDAHDQHVKSFGGYVKVVASGSSKE